MEKQYKILKFEEIINNIQLSIDVANEIGFKDIENDLELLLSKLNNIYDTFALSEDSAP